MDKIRGQFKDMYKKHDVEKLCQMIPNKEKYTSIEILKYLKQLKGIKNITVNANTEILHKIKTHLLHGDKNKLSHNIILINEFLNCVKSFIIASFMLSRASQVMLSRHLQGSSSTASAAIVASVFQTLVFL